MNTEATVVGGEEGDEADEDEVDALMIEDSTMAVDTMTADLAVGGTRSADWTPATPQPLPEGTTPLGGMTRM